MSLKIANIFYFLLTCQQINSCPPLFVNLGGHCYFFGTQASSWFEAWADCARLRSTLVGIETFQESYELFNYIHNLSADYPEMESTKGIPNLKLQLEETMTNAAYWTSGANFLGHNSWTWMGSGQPFFTTNWCPGQPDNKNGNEHCVALLFSGKKHCWNDRSCQVRESVSLEVDTFYICEINPSIVKYNYHT